jgi:hypothetical protein
MAQVLQLAHLVEHHGVAQVDVGRRRVQAQLDAQGTPVASDAASFWTHSSLGSSSSTPRNVTSSACYTFRHGNVLTHLDS